ncbi:MAG TPA: hypothetical protein VNP93_00080 [Gaiellaceae bacterium]|nr:hypothetical protein [Gaiellaceae bacterium]
MRILRGTVRTAWAIALAVVFLYGLVDALYGGLFGAVVLLFESVWMTRQGPGTIERWIVGEAGEPQSSEVALFVFFNAFFAVASVICVVNGDLAARLIAVAAALLFARVSVVSTRRYVASQDWE